MSFLRRRTAEQELRRRARRAERLDRGARGRDLRASSGRTGPGKSTLLNLLSGIYQPDSGSLLFSRTSLDRPSGAPAGAPRHGAHLPEDPALQAAHAPRERARRLPRPPGRAALEVLPRRRASGPASATRRWSCSQFVGLAARANDRAGALPYGQQRMLEIARALATRPAPLHARRARRRAERRRGRFPAAGGWRASASAASRCSSSSTTWTSS